MLYLAHKLLQRELAKDLKQRLISSPDWVDGRETALGRAKQIKRNFQLKLGDSYKKFTQEILEVLRNDSSLQAYAMPTKFFSILFSRTGEGMFYGPHCDMPYHANGRRDLSFTIFLNDSSEYEGGELILNIPPLRQSIKLNAGEIIVYPTKYLHEVLKVTSGERFVCVGWIQSQISSDLDRDILWTMRKGLSELKKIENSESAFETLNLAYFNIYKRFMD